MDDEEKALKHLAKSWIGEADCINKKTRDNALIPGFGVFIYTAWPKKTYMPVLFFGWFS